ncbi:hypothetical protein [Novosphingobium sp. KA1]|uniref:hypothetical protein n=1 Tax=Novosphingobium sp. (strain KA1) TaxID=164608 RepID=UPI001A909AC3|nr:hypothetical protein [Novosphingobium sp. KA1]
MKSSDGSENAQKQNPGAVDPMLSERLLWNGSMKNERPSQRSRQAVNISGNKQAVERAGQALIDALWADGFRSTRERAKRLHSVLGRGLITLR